MTPRPEPRPRLSPLRHSPYGLGLRDDSRGTAAIQPGNQATSTPTTTDAKWGHFRPSRRGQCKPSFSQSFLVDELLTSDFGVYVACFCQSGDLLSQWRGYGKDHGYAVELRIEALHDALTRIPAYPAATGLFQVRYGHSAADSVVKNALQEVSTFNLNHPGVKARYSALALSSMLAQVKHPGFAEEHEWRVVIGLQILDESEIARDRERTLFRSTPRAIVPYVELPLGRDAITSIRVGPGENADVREAGVRRLLRAHGLKATVTHSEVPLRH